MDGGYRTCISATDDKVQSWRVAGRSANHIGWFFYNKDMIMSQRHSAGVLIDKLGLSQIGVSLCLSLNEIEAHYLDMDIIVFNGTPDRLPTTARFAITPHCEVLSCY